MIPRFIPAALLSGLAGVLATAGPTPDRDLGLSKGSVFDTQSPAVEQDNATDPGEVPVLPRAYLGAPPRIPHGIADFTPIVRGENLCLDCHLVEEKVEGEPTPIPESHFRDLRRAPAQVRDQIAGARYVCTSCHLPITDAVPPVGNTF